MATKRPDHDVRTRQVSPTDRWRAVRPTPAEQRTARIMGAWFLGTFLFSIPAFFFYDPVLNDVDYVVGGGTTPGSAIGALLEILLAICGIATAVVIFPIAKRVSESVALGYVAARTVESILILVGVLSLMAVVALRRRPRGHREYQRHARRRRPRPGRPCTNRPACSVRSSAPGSATASFSAT